LVNAFDAIEQVLHAGKVTTGRQRERGDPTGNGPDGPEHAALDREDVLHIPLHRGGHGYEPQAFASGRAVQDDHVGTRAAAV